MKLVKHAVLASALVASLNSVPASASGAIADFFIRPFSPQLADQADRLNHQLGRPVENAVAGAADAYLPGSGAALRAGWQIQRQIQDAEAAARTRARAQPLPPVAQDNFQYNSRPNYRNQGGHQNAGYSGNGGYQNNSGFQGASVCRAGMFFVTNRGTGPVGAPCGAIMDQMGGVWPGFFSPN